jgi:hypothetical protein
MTYDEVADKLRGSADFAQWETAKTEKIVALVRDLERMKKFSDLAVLLRK